MKKCYFNADILLPDLSKHDPQKWAVIACDQFTSEPEYWEKAKAIVGEAPSTLDMILPEVYLDETEARLPIINAKMKEYAGELLTEYPDSMIYLERTQSDGTVRRGIILAVDLEAYDYTKGANALIRATEATVIERIPPRVAIRRNACLELPHIMLLVDDPKLTVIEPISFEDCDSVVYDFDLMLDGGHLRGGLIGDEAKEKIAKALDALITPEAMAEKYGDEGLAPFMFAVGDGNHSLASAKAMYEEIKSAIGAEAAMTHPARYALAEVVNIHSEALKFEPIYRIMTDVEPEDVITSFKQYIDTLCGGAEAQEIEYIYGDKCGNITVATPEQQLAVGTVQRFIDDYIAKNPKAKVDYIHGEDSVKALAKKEKNIGFIFSGMEKSQLFKTVIFDGALPRKTFSMGHAQDKRYYLECRKIK